MITAALPKLARIIEKQGELFGCDVTRLTGLQLPMADARDKRVVHQRRSVVLTNTLVQKRKDEKRKAVEAKNAEKKVGKKRGRPIGSKNKAKKIEAVSV